MKLPASVAALRRNLATVGQDELHTALYKTTQVDDGLPPKEKHVRLLVRAAATEAERARLIAALGKRLQLCRDARTAPLAAKALTIVHRLVHAGHGLSLVAADAISHELTAVCSFVSPSASRWHAETVAACAAYLRELCDWEEAHRFLRAGDLAWQQRRPSELMLSLQKLRPLLLKAIICLERGASGDASIDGLRLAIAEDALSLFSSEAEAVSLLQRAMLRLTPELVLETAEALELFGKHTRRMLPLQESIAEELRGFDAMLEEAECGHVPTAASSVFEGASIIQGLKKSLLWLDGGEDLPYAQRLSQPCPDGDSEAEGARLERRSGFVTHREGGNDSDSGMSASSDVSSVGSSIGSSVGSSSLGSAAGGVPGADSKLGRRERKMGASLSQRLHALRPTRHASSDRKSVV